MRTKFEIRLNDATTFEVSSKNALEHLKKSLINNHDENILLAFEEVCKIHALSDSCFYNDYPDITD